MKHEIINIIAKLDNGSHSSNQLQGVDEALLEIFKKEIAKYQDALVWCSGSADFHIDGQAREGWIRLCLPLINKKYD